MSEIYAGETRETETKEAARNNPETGLSEVSPYCTLSSQEIAEQTCSETMEQVLTSFKDIMPEEQLVRIDIETELYKPSVMSSEEYSQRFSETDPSVLGHCDETGKIYLKDSAPEVIRHVATHETMHRASFQETNDRQIGMETYRSGIREVVFCEGHVVEDNHQALNEGITELYAIKAMQHRGETASIESVCTYPEACQKAFELQEIVGKELLQRAYFGGERNLVSSEVIRLNGGEKTTWETYTRHVDILEYSTNPREIRESKKELTLLQSIMIANKEASMYTQPIAKLS